MTEKGIDKRLTLKITEVSEPKDVGKDRSLMKLEFKAKGEDGDKEHNYFTFSTRLFDYIKKDTEIECDVNISKREWGDTTYTDRKVTQIYIDGQPVNVRRSGGYQDSPEKIASIEAQCAVKTVLGLYGQIQVAAMSNNFPSELLEKLETHQNLFAKALAWCDAHIPTDDAPKPEAPKTEKVKAPEAEAPEDLRNLVIKNLGDLFRACYKHFKLTQSATLKELGGIAKEDITDPQEAWLQIVATYEKPK